MEHSEQGIRHLRECRSRSEFWTDYGLRTEARKYIISIGIGKERIGFGMVPGWVPTTPYVFDG